MCRQKGTHLWVLSTDGMDQAKTTLPHQKQEDHATNGMAGLQMHVVSTVVYGAPVPLIGLINMADLCKNSALTVTNLHRAIEIQWQAEMKKNGGELVEWPSRLHICFDNAPGENINKHVFHYLAALVHHGVFSRITIGTLLVGHTHNINDQMFSVWAKYLRAHDVKTLAEMLRVFSENYHGHVRESLAEEELREAQEEQQKSTKEATSSEQESDVAGVVLGAPASTLPTALLASPGPVALSASHAKDEFDFSSLIHQQEKQPNKIRRHTKVEALNDLLELGIRFNPQMELVEFNVDVGSFFGAEHMKKHPTLGLIQYHCFTFDQDVNGATWLHCKFLSDSDQQYSNIPHLYEIGGDRWRAAYLMFDADERITHDPYRLPPVVVETSELQELLSKLAVTFMDADELETYNVIIAKLSARVVETSASCSTCGKLVADEAEIGVISRAPKGCSAAEKTAVNARYQQRNQVRKNLVAHLADKDPAVVKAHRGRLITGWWTDWIDRSVKIKHLYRSRSLPVFEMIEEGRTGYLQHPLDSTANELRQSVRVEVDRMAVYGPPVPGDFVALRASDDDRMSEHRPPFWIARVVEYSSPDPKELEFDRASARHHSYLEDLSQGQCGSDASLSVKPVDPYPSRSKRKLIVCDRHKNPTDEYTEWFKTKTKAKSKRGSKDQISTLSSELGEDTCKRTHIRVEWFIHTRVLSAAQAAASSLSSGPSAAASSNSLSADQSDVGPVDLNRLKRFQKDSYQPLNKKTSEFWLPTSEIITSVGGLTQTSSTAGISSRS